MHKVLRVLTFSIFFLNTLTPIHSESIKKEPCHPWCEVDDSGKQIHYDQPYISLHKQQPEDN